MAAYAASAFGATRSLAFALSLLALGASRGSLRSPPQHFFRLVIGLDFYKRLLHFSLKYATIKKI